MKDKKKIKKRLKNNSDLANIHGYDRHYYLEKLGIDIEKCGVNFCENTDPRYDKWMKERKKYGFDSRETWCLDKIFIEWLYEHLKLYKKEASKYVDLSYNTFNISGMEYPQEIAIDTMIGLLEDILVNRSNDDLDFTEDNIYKIKLVLDIWGEVLPAMWW